MLLLIELSIVSDQLCLTLLSGLPFYLGRCSNISGHIWHKKRRMWVRLYITKDPDNVLMLKGSVRDLALSCTLTAAFASVLRKRFHSYVAN